MRIYLQYLPWRLTSLSQFFLPRWLRPRGWCSWRTRAERTSPPAPPTGTAPATRSAAPATAEGSTSAWRASSRTTKIRRRKKNRRSGKGERRREDQNRRDAWEIRNDNEEEEERVMGEQKTTGKTCLRINRNENSLDYQQNFITEGRGGGKLRRSLTDLETTIQHLVPRKNR